MGSADEAHRSDMRALMAEATEGDYVCYGSLAEVQADPNGAVIFEGDYGGQIYAAFPARVVHCSDDALLQVLHDIDAIFWNDDEGARVVYERVPTGSGVAGGMGGGVVTPNGWLHPEIDRVGISDEVRAIISGFKPRMSQEARSSTRPPPQRPRLP